MLRKWIFLVMCCSLKFGLKLLCSNVNVNSSICNSRMLYRPFVSLNHLLLLNMKCWSLKELLSRPGILLHPRASAAHGSHLRMSSQVSDTRVQKASLFLGELFGRVSYPVFITSLHIFSMRCISDAAGVQSMSSTRPASVSVLEKDLRFVKGRLVRGTGLLRRNKTLMQLMIQLNSLKCDYNADRLPFPAVSTMEYCALLVGI
jgi:hypothetical protein